VAASKRFDAEARTLADIVAQLGGRASNDDIQTHLVRQTGVDERLVALNDDQLIARLNHAAQHGLVAREPGRRQATWRSTPDER
jgi:hypothetical protein